jgi:parallel beta-helix repeat protein
LKAKQSIFLIITLILMALSVSNISAADYNVNNLADVSGINSWLSSGASSGDTLFFNLNPTDIINSLSNLVITVSINIISNTETIIQGNPGENLFDIRANNVNISGLTINNFGQAITVNGGNNTTIKNNTFNNNQGSIAIYNSNNSTATNNTIKNNGANNAIGLGNSNNTKVENNTIENSTGTGIATWDSHDNEITNNKITNITNGDGIYARGSNHKIINNEIENAGTGIYIQNSNNTTISENKANNNRYSGINLERSNNSQIKDNSASYNKHNGIVLSSWDQHVNSYNSIINNTCNYNGEDSNLDSGFYNGIHISGNSAFTSIINNTAEGNYRSGIAIGRGYWDIYNDMLIQGNIVRYNHNNGILVNSNESIVDNNIAEYNNHSGISILGSGNKINSNTVGNNNLSGIYIGGDYYSQYNGTNEVTNNLILNNYEGITIASSNNIIMRNSLINNTIGLKLNNFHRWSFDYDGHSSINTTNNTFEYNRIVNSTSNFQVENRTSIVWGYDPETNSYGEINVTGDIANNSGNFNWWGLNDPEESIFQNNSAFNATYWFVTNLTSLQDTVDEGVPALFNYTIGLNDPSVAADSMNLPYFTFEVYGTSYDARLNQTLQKIFNVTTDTEETVGFFVDNQWLEATVNVIDIPTPLPPITTPTPTPTPDSIDPEYPDNTTNTTESNNNPSAKADVMKKTGMPIIAILIVFLSSLGLVYRKK